MCEADLRGQHLHESLKDGTVSVWRHHGAPRQLVLRLKHGSVSRAADILSQGMIEKAKAMQLPTDVVVTWVTMPKGRRRRRGIDHGYELARRVAEGLNAQCLPLLIRREGLRHTQEGLNRQKRISNLASAFGCVPMQGECVLLVDDVHTTGATSLYCTMAMLSAGAREVWTLTATAVPDKKREEQA